MPGLAAEGAGEVAGAHRGALGERLDPQVGVEVVGDPGLELAQRPALGELGLEVGAELGLAAGALEEEDEPAGGLDARSRGRGPPRPCASARSMPEVTPAEVQTSPSRTKIGFGSTVSSGWRRASSAADGPVGGDGPALEQPGARQQEGAGADGADPARAAGGAADPADQLSSSSASATPKPPATTRVSIGPRQRAAVVFGASP